MGQVSIPSLSQVYHTSTIGRRRSSDIPIDTLGSTQYTRRPRANTSFSSQYAPQDLSDFATRVVLPGRASFDFSSYLTGGTDEQALQQYRRESGAGADEAEGEEYEE